MSNNINLSIGDISISIDKNRIKETLKIPPAYSPFIKTGTPDICLRLHPGEPDISGAQKVFESQPIWTLQRSNGRFILNIYDGMPGLARILVFPPELDTADLYFLHNSGFLVDPFVGPTMELLMINYLALGRGVILHGCGIEIEGQGILFVGESGAGKSTIANLWNTGGGIEIFSDDRIIIRKNGENFRMYGTPWHGEAQFVSPRGVRLKKIFFLCHAGQNEIKLLNGVESVQQLLKCSFPPFWDSRGMEFSMDLFAELATVVPCCRLGFKPDRGVIDFISNQEC